MDSIIDYLEHWTAIHPNKCFSSFLDIQGDAKETYTYLEFHERSRYLAEYLSTQVNLKCNDRVLLVYPPGLEIIVAFVACAHIGVIPVPVYPPRPVDFERDLMKIVYVLQDCGATAILTTRDYYCYYQAFSKNLQDPMSSQTAVMLTSIAWVLTDDVRGQASEGFHNHPGSILFLQYTSGSTSDPKGVIVSHENVIHNCGVTVDHVPTAVCWLPQYHDMGLIGYYVYLIITGGTTYGFSPIDFLKRPILWLETLSHTRATYTSSPNFGFEYCLREDKIPSDQLGDLELSSVRVLMNGAEPVSADTFQRFLNRFRPYGLQPQACVVAYGLAENTLAVTNYGRRIVTVNKQLLHEGTVHFENTQLLNDNQIRLVSCGRPINGVHLRIVDPQSHANIGSNRIGEIWLAGKSTCQGYWNRPELTHETFHNTVINDPQDHNNYLRTGDLGFLESNELFVCGRIKDLIIIRGVNYYPQDIENIVESASPKIRNGGVVAFSGNEEEETFVIVVEVRDAEDLPGPANISRLLRAHYYTGPHTIVFVPPRTITKTTSGKISRSLMRQRWLDNQIPIIAAYTSGKEKDFPSSPPSGLKTIFQGIFAPYNLTGQEDWTLSEIGIDSLSMVQLLLEIDRLLEEFGIPKLVKEIDGRLLQRLTVRDLFSLIDKLEQLDKSAEKPIATLQFILGQIKQENDDYERGCMREDAILGSLNCVNLPASDRTLINVLFTGPTGFFGPFLLNSLLLKTPYTYFVLIRAADQHRGMERIYDSLCNAHLLTPALKEQIEKRVRVVCGDLSKHNLGMNSELWASLTTRVQGIIHNAALVNYVLNYDTLRPHNVFGTRELLRFSFTGARKEFHFISSTIIFGWTSKGNLSESENNPDLQNLDFGYAQSKWVAEQLVFAAAEQGLDVRIYRPAFLSASSSGIANKDDIVIRLLAFMINHGIAVNAQHQISLIPADIAADNIADIFMQRQTSGNTLHVTVDDYYNMIDITRLITREYGYPFVYYDIPDFVAELTRHCVKGDPLYPFLDFIARSHLKLATMQNKRYDNSQYRQARQMSSNSRVDPPLSKTMSYVMSFLLREGIIPQISEIKPNSS